MQSGRQVCFLQTVARYISAVTQHRTYYVHAETPVFDDYDPTNQSRFSVHVTRTQCLVLGSCCNLFSVYSIRMVVLSLGQLFGTAVVPCATHCDFVF